MDKENKNTIRRGGKYTLIVFCLCIFAGIQLHRPDKNIQQTITYTDFLVSESAPEIVRDRIHSSCYNCHSNHTNYEWYDAIAPISWYVDNNIKKGKLALNFSNWKTADYRDKRAHLSRIAKSLRENSMPLKSYTVLHKDANISAIEKQQLLDWLYTLEIKPTN